MQYTIQKVLFPDFATENLWSRHQSEPSFNAE